MFQIHEVKLLSSFGEVLGLLTAIITLSNNLTNPSSPKCSTGVIPINDVVSDIVGLLHGLDDIEGGPAVDENDVLDLFQMFH